MATATRVAAFSAGSASPDGVGQLTAENGLGRVNLPRAGRKKPGDTAPGFPGSG